MDGIHSAMYGSFAAAAPTIGDTFDADAGQPNVLFKSFMTLRNEEKDEETLYQHLSQLARTSSSFTDMGYTLEEVHDAAHILARLGVSTLRQLLDKETMFTGQQPGWAYEDSETTRAVAEFLRGRLLWMKQEVMAGGPRGSKRRSQTPDREDGRGRSRDKRERRHKKSKRNKRDKSDGSSSSSSSGASHAKSLHNNVVAQFRESAFTSFGLDLLPADELVASIGKVNRRLNTLGVQKVSKKPIEEFVPSYLGREQPRKERRRIVQERKDKTTLTVAQFMEHWMGFWLSHGIYGLITLPAFCTAISIQTKMLSEHGATYALRYFRALIPHINAKISTLEKGDIIKDLDSFIITLKSDLISEINSFSHVASWDSRPPGDQKKQKQQHPSVQQLPPQKKQGTAPPCVYHNPKMGMFCKRGSACNFKHLDTNVPNQLKEFNEAAAPYQFKAAKGSSNKGKSKGKNKGKNKQK